MYAIYFLTAVAAAFASSKVIDRLYHMPNAPVSFPHQLHGKKIGRKIFLTVAYSVAFIYCEKMPSMDFIYHMTALFFLTLITVTDFEQYVIFDKILFLFSLSGLLLAVALHLPLAERLVAAICGGTFFFLLMVLTKDGIGGGDVKLIAVLGLWLGIESLINTILTASILGGICAAGMIFSGAKGRNDYFAVETDVSRPNLTYIFF